MKKYFYLKIPAFIVAISLSIAACGGGNGEQPNDSEATQNAVQVIQDTTTTPTDSLATELDAASEEIEQETRALQSALDSL